MKLLLSKVIGRPMMAGGMIVGFEFLEALKKLASDPLPVKERYALARTIEDVERWIKAWEATRLELMGRFCIPRATYLQRRAEKLAEEIEEAQSGEVNHPGLKGMRESLTRIQEELKACKPDQRILDPDDPGAQARFSAALEDAQAEVVDLFLEHRVKLPAESKLTGNEMVSLMDLIEEPT